MGYNKNSYSAVFGDLCQEIVIKFMTKEYGWTWIAGERNSKVENQGLFSVLKNFVKIRTEKEPKIEFVDTDGWNNLVLMPDELFMSENSYNLTEIKGRDRSSQNGNKDIFEKKVKIDAYSRTKREFQIPVWLIFCLSKGNGYNIYISDIDNAIENASQSYYVQRYGQDEYGNFFEKTYKTYLWKTPAGFKKLNKVLLPENYLEVE